MAQKYWFPLLLLVLLAGAAAYVISRSSEDKGDLPVVQPAPDYTLTNMNGEQVRARDNAGKVVLMEFMFTSCPDICPATTYKMVQLQEELKAKGWFGSEVQLVAVTFDPEVDTPEVLREYADRMGIDPAGWHVLRGEEAATRDLAERYGIQVMKLGDGQFVHTVTSLQLIDADQRVRKVYSMGDEMNIEEIWTDIASLVAERTPSERP